MISSELVLERTRRLAYSVARSIGMQHEEMSLESLHRPIVEAIRQGDRAAARQAVIHDIQQAQTILVGLASRDFAEAERLRKRSRSKPIAAESGTTASPGKHHS